MSVRTFGSMKLQAGRRWVIEADPHVIMWLKRLLKRADRGNPGKLIMDHTMENCRDLEWIMQRWPLVVDPPEALREAAQGHRDRVLRLEQYVSQDYDPPAFDMVCQPRTYQARSAAIVHEQGHLLVADELGLGKTCTGLTVLTGENALPAVVVTLTHLPRQWEAEVRKFMPALLTYVPKKASPVPLPTFMGRPTDVVITSYSKLAGWAQVLSGWARTIIFDECQELRRPGSMKYTAAKHIAKEATYRVGLSATPIYNYGDEIHSVEDVLAPGALGSRAEFDREWCTPMGNGRSRIKNPRAFGSWARENFIMLRHTRKEVGRELPEVVRVAHDVEADEQQLEEVAGDAGRLARLLLDGGPQKRGAALRASEELSSLLRQATGLAKAPYVAQFVRMLVSQGERVLLAGWHRAVYGVWEEALKDLRVGWYTGSESPAAKQRSRDAFVDGELDVLMISLRSGAGLDGLQEAGRVVVFGELDWSPGVHEQVIGRLHRDGQTEPVLAYYLVAKDGSDPVVADTLGVKREQVEGLRDPSAEAVVQQAKGDHVKALARDFLKRRGG